MNKPPFWQIPANLGLVLWKVLSLFLAALAPLMFLVGVIVLLDRWGTHARFLENLEKYGQPAKATISYINNEYNRAGLDFLDSQGRLRYGSLDLRYYSPQTIQALQPGVTVRILYIDKVVSESEKTALLEEYAAVKSAPPVTADVWVILGISWLIVAFQPQFVFLGLDEFDRLMPPERVFGKQP